MSAPRLHVDVTTAHAEAGRIPHGTVRVERGLVGALASSAACAIGYCRYQRTLGRFVDVPAADALQIVRAPIRHEFRREPRAPARAAVRPALRLARRVELFARGKIRDPLRRAAAEAFHRLVPQPIIFERGGVLLIPGELQRHDFAVLMRLRRQAGVRLAFVFYDLLGTLPAGDPRLADPDTADLPGTDFMAREADLLLAISRHSAQVLRENLAARNLRCPPLEVIELAGNLEADTPVPVDGLAPGAFVLTVGDVVGRKNHALLIAVWRRLWERSTAIPRLVIAGRVHSGEASLVQSIERDKALRQCVSILPNIDNEQLAWLYANCRFTAFPSLAEGFGLPVAESLAAGKVCVASSSTSMPEASQGLAIHLDPHDEGAWYAAIERLIAGDDELRERERDIRTRFRRIGWGDTAAQVRRMIGSRFDLPH